MQWRFLTRWLQRLPHDLAHFPWFNTAATLHERFREDRLGLTASSLTFTTTLALVPFFTVLLAVFTAFPVFGKVQQVLEKWLVESLIPTSIARQVMDYLMQFANKASKLGSVGLAATFVSAIALMLTIDRTLNAIWRVKRPRPLAQRVLVYWAALTLGPLLLGASLAATSYAMTASKGLVGAMPDAVSLVINLFEITALALGAAALFRYVPNTAVKWRHALSGGLFVALGIESGKSLLTLYLSYMPTYSAVYGTFATVPILLIWIYTSWLILLLGAVIAAYLPSLTTGVARRAGSRGWHFQLGVEVLQVLHRERDSRRHGLPLMGLARRLRVDVLQLVPVMETLTALDWVGLLQEQATGAQQTEPTEPRYVLLADPAQTPLQPLVDQLLLTPANALQPFTQASGVPQMRLADAL